MCVNEDKTTVVVVASYRSVSRNPFRFKALVQLCILGTIICSLREELVKLSIEVPRQCFCLTFTFLLETISGLIIKEGSDRVVVPWYLMGGTLCKHRWNQYQRQRNRYQSWWNHRVEPVPNHVSFATQLPEFKETIKSKINSRHYEAGSS